MRHFQNFEGLVKGLNEQKWDSKPGHPSALELGLGSEMCVRVGLGAGKPAAPSRRGLSPSSAVMGRVETNDLPSSSASLSLALWTSFPLCHYSFVSNPMLMVPVGEIHDFSLSCHSFIRSFIHSFIGCGS